MPKTISAAGDPTRTVTPCCWLRASPKEAAADSFGCSITQTDESNESRWQDMVQDISPVVSVEEPVDVDPNAVMQRIVDFYFHHMDSIGIDVHLVRGHCKALVPCLCSRVAVSSCEIEACVQTVECHI